jgi:hypothetical protein
MAWDELNLLKSLPPHPNIVPFDRVVLEDVESRVIGFIIKYIPGGTLDNLKLPFRFEWTCNRELDSDVSTFRNFLNEWVTSRKSGGDMVRYLNAPNRLIWLDVPTAPDYSVPFEFGTTLDGETNWVTDPRWRRTAMEIGQYVFCWERPPRSRLRKSENGV